ncbi:hypothetical protein D9M70_471390 [compost metagenome]
MREQPVQAQLGCIVFEAIEVGERVQRVAADPVRGRQGRQDLQHGVGDRHALEHIDPLFEQPDRARGVVVLV